MVIVQFLFINLGALNYRTKKARTFRINKKQHSWINWHEEHNNQG